MIKIEIENYIKFPTGVLDSEIETTYRIINPDFVDLCRRKGLYPNSIKKGFLLAKTKVKGKWITNQVSKYLLYWEKKNDHYLLPRGSFFVLKVLLNKHNIKYKLFNKTKTFNALGLSFKGVLKEEMGQLAVEDYSYNNSIIQAPTGSGKTCMALYIAAKINQPFIIVVDTKELLNQWISRIQSFLGIHKNEIGIVGSGSLDFKNITVALIQTLRKNTSGLLKFGFLIVDECHIAATESYKIAVNNYSGRYVLGLSATPDRRDGKTDFMKWLLGDIKTKIDMTGSKRTPSTVQFINTDFKSKISFQYQYSRAMVTLTEDNNRNKLIVNTIMKNIDLPGIHLVLSQSAIHIKLLWDLLPGNVKKVSRILIGSVRDEERRKIIKEMGIGKIKIIFATSQLLGKGFDEPLLSVLHLTTPIKDPGRLAQYIGRITRIHSGKEESRIFDYYDSKERILSISAKSRSKTYTELNIKRI